MLIRTTATQSRTGARGHVGVPGPERTPEKPAVCKEDLDGTDIRCRR